VWKFGTVETVLLPSSVNSIEALWASFQFPRAAPEAHVVWHEHLLIRIFLKSQCCRLPFFVI
jgi:hypothetical protein